MEVSKPPMVALDGEVAAERVVVGAAAPVATGLSKGPMPIR